MVACFFDKKRPFFSKKGGFLLFEALVAIFIFTISVLPITKLYYDSHQIYTEALYRMKALNIAIDVLETKNSFDYSREKQWTNGEFKVCVKRQSVIENYKPHVSSIQNFLQQKNISNDQTKCKIDSLVVSVYWNYGPKKSASLTCIGSI